MIRIMIITILLLIIIYTTYGCYMHYIPQTRDPEIPQLLVPFVGESVTLASRWIDQNGLFWIVIEGRYPRHQSLLG